MTTFKIGKNLANYVSYRGLISEIHLKTHKRQWQKKYDLKIDVKKRMSINVQMGHFAVQQKLTEHCTSSMINFFN